MRGLTARSGAIAVPLRGIAVGDVQRFIDARFASHALPPELAETIHRTTAGTPLFMVSVIDDLVERRMLATHEERWTLAATFEELAAHRPDSITQLIDLQLDRLTSTEQRVLEVAGVIGMEFVAGLVAAGLGEPFEAVDDVCDAMARRGLFLGRTGSEEWPDGTLHTRYGFAHALVQHVCLSRSAPARRQRWHRLVAERLEVGFGAQAPEISAVLASHFHHGNLPARAVHYYLIAAERTAQQFATADAMRLFQAAHDDMQRLPATSERDELELRILGGIAPAALRTNDHAIGGRLTVFERTLELANRIDDAPRRFVALANLCVRYSLLAQYGHAAAVGAQLEALGATAAIEPNLLELGTTVNVLHRFWSGHVAQAHQALDALVIPGHTVGGTIPLAIQGPTDLTVLSYSYFATTCWLVGEAERALVEGQRGLDLARANGDPYALGLMHLTLARIHFLRRDPASTIRAHAEVVLGTRGAEVWHPLAQLFVAWASTHDAPLAPSAAETLIAQFQGEVARYPMSTTLLSLPLVDALRRSHLHAQAGALVDRMLAFAAAHDERVVEPELLAIAGDLAPDPATASAHYQASLARAIASGSRAFEGRIRARAGKPQD